MFDSTLEQRLDKLTRKVNDLHEKIAQELEDELQRVVVLLSSQYPRDMIVGWSAMGTWDISRQEPNDEFGQAGEYWDDQIPDYLNDAFGKTASDYTFSAIPVVQIRAHAGKFIEKKKDW